MLSLSMLFYLSPFDLAFWIQRSPAIPRAFFYRKERSLRKGDKI